MKVTTVVFLLCVGMAEAQTIKVDYLYNSGWIIETASTFVLIDFVPNGNENLTNEVAQKITTALQNSKPVYILVTHDHPDHYSPVINRWVQPRIGFVYGWLIATAHEGAISLENRDSIKLSNIEIFAHPSTGSGSAFLVKLPELTFYHAGDHALWTTKAGKRFKTEVRYISTKGKIDIAFLPVVREKPTGCKTDDMIFSGAMTAQNILKPAITFPMHLSCGNFSAFTDWKSFALRHQLNGQLEIPTQYNQHFEFVLK
jgi:L-ascorbate metabolism protein UlaG (beta-lactamase superfamily)